LLFSGCGIGLRTPLQILRIATATR
jgi:hypothetical protein